jgi:hypothetical protein
MGGRATRKVWGAQRRTKKVGHNHATVTGYHSPNHGGVHTVPAQDKQLRTHRSGKWTAACRHAEAETRYGLRWVISLHNTSHSSHAVTYMTADTKQMMSPQT